MSAEPGSPAGSFGLEAFTQDDRLRLFAFTNAEKASAYLWTLRAFERGPGQLPPRCIRSDDYRSERSKVNQW